MKQRHHAGCDTDTGQGVKDNVQLNDYQLSFVKIALQDRGISIERRLNDSGAFAEDHGIVTNNDNVSFQQCIPELWECISFSTREDRSSVACGNTGKRVNV